MSKLDAVIYNKLLLQAEEANDQGMVKLANSIAEAIGSESRECDEQYSYSSLQDDIHTDIWKIATKLIAYYNPDSVDALKINEAITILAEKMTDELELTLGVDKIVRGPFEPSLPGESK
jgi:hypothetical protein